MANNKRYVLVCGNADFQASLGQQAVEIFNNTIAEHSLADSTTVLQSDNIESYGDTPLVRIMPGNTVYRITSEADCRQIAQTHIVAGNIVEPLQAKGYVYNYPVPDGKQLHITLRDAKRSEDVATAIANHGYAALDRCLSSMSPHDVIRKVQTSKLRGRGGAGFLTGDKWEVCAKADAKQKYLICNAGEGDHDSLTVLEGMTICAYAVGATRGIIFFRAEGAPAVARMRAAIEEARANGLLGENIMGFDFSFDVELHFGMGSFVCGEETALIQYLQGNRCEPFIKQPYPAKRGLYGMPTVVNNIETFATIPAIVYHGAHWFASLGNEHAHGTKVFALSGPIKKEGLIEVPFGITMREIVFEIGGGMKKGTFKAAQIGGPLGGFIAERDLDRPIDYEMLEEMGAIMGGGSIVVHNDSSCIPTIVKNNMNFSADESCGKCTPCRIGTKRLSEILDRITDAEGSMDDLQELRILAQTIKDTALCGLGRSAPNGILSTIDVFWDEYAEHVCAHRCAAGACKKMATFAINPDICIGCGLCFKNCPVQAISRTDYVAPGHKLASMTINTEQCIKCGTCKAGCKFGAIYVK